MEGMMTEEMYSWEIKTSLTTTTFHYLKHFSSGQKIEQDMTIICIHVHVQDTCTCTCTYVLKT